MSLHQSLSKIIPTNAFIQQGKQVYNYFFRQSTIHSTKVSPPPISPKSYSLLKEKMPQQPMYWLTYGGPILYK